MESKLLIASGWGVRQVSKWQFETDRTILCLDCLDRYTSTQRTKFTHIYTQLQIKLGKYEKVDYYVFQ